MEATDCEINCGRQVLGCLIRLILEAIGNVLVYWIVFIAPNEVHRLSTKLGYGDTVNLFVSNEDAFMKGIRYIHTEWRVPCWAAIAIGTIIMKGMLYPLIMITPKNSPFGVRQFTVALTTILDKDIVDRQENVTFPHSMWTVLPIVQAILFARGFHALVYPDKDESVQAGERELFGDVTIPDQYNIVLPLLIVATCVLDYEMERYQVDDSKFGYMKYIARGIKPITFFPIAIVCPARIQIYWTVWGIVSLPELYYLADSNHAQNVKGPSTNQKHRLFPVAPRAPEENGYYDVPD